DLAALGGYSDALIFIAFRGPQVQVNQLRKSSRPPSHRISLLFRITFQRRVKHDRTRIQRARREARSFSKKSRNASARGDLDKAVCSPSTHCSRGHDSRQG